MLHAIGLVVMVLAVMAALGAAELARFVWRLGVFVAVLWLLAWLALVAVADHRDVALVGLLAFGSGEALAILTLAGGLAWVFGALSQHPS